MNLQPEKKNHNNNMSLKSFTWLLVIIGLTASNFMLYKPSPYRSSSATQNAIIAITANPTSVSRPTSTSLPSATAIPSATIDYKSTAEAAQVQVDISKATADEARRVNAMATAQYIALINEQARITAESEQRIFEIYSWTATAALTSVPLTSTQQAVINTQVPRQQQLMSAQLTATQGAPTLEAAIISNEYKRVYGKAEHIGQIAFQWTVIISAVLFLIWLFKRWDQEERHLRLMEHPDVTPVKDTVVQMRRDKGGGDYSQTRYVIPCTPEQLTEFAKHVTQGKKSLAINQWEGVDTLFTRNTYMPLRAWMREEREDPFVVATEDNQLAPTNIFLEFLMGWLDREVLPMGFEFVKEIDTTPSLNDEPAQNHDDLPGKTLMSMRNHTYEREGEAVPIQ
jgi:hypothetical protein